LAQFSDDVQPLASLADFQPRVGAPTRLEAALGWALDNFAAGAGAGKLVISRLFPARALRPRPRRGWPPQIAVELIALKPPSVDNAAVRRISLLTPYAAEQMEIEALVALPGRDAAARTVTLEAEGLRET